MTIPSRPDAETRIGSGLSSTVPKAVHRSADPVLTALRGLGGVLGEVVEAYPGLDQIEAAPDWLDRWFTGQAVRIFGGSPPPEVAAVPIDEVARATADDRPRALKVERIVSVRPHWFRGFRTLKEPVPLDSGLVLIDGRNSTGKTSLAEALEWLFNGELARRALGGQGNARELEDCIGNHFRPEDAETSVEAIFRLGGGETFALKRVLVEDYGPTTTSVCTSRLFKDGVELSPEAGAELLDALFGGAPPLLMQHTLRLFVHNTPFQRRQYFERLLRMDELAALVERAVIGPNRLPQIVHAGFHATLGAWIAFKDGLPAERSRLTRLERHPPTEIADDIRSALVSIARTAHGVDCQSFVEARSCIEAAQSATRQRRLPMLGELRPKRRVDDALLGAFAIAALQEKLAMLKAAVGVRETARASAKEITDAQLAIAGAMAALTAAKLLPTAPEASIVCPVCEYDEPTLSAERMRTVRGWEPVRSALEKADAAVSESAQELRQHLQGIYKERKGARPAQPSDAAWEAALVGADKNVAAAVEVFRATIAAHAPTLDAFDDSLIVTGKRISESPIDAAVLKAIEADAARCMSLLNDVVDGLRRYGNALSELERVIGSQAGADTVYATRDRWLTVGKNADQIAEDLAWVQAKVATASVLDRVRTELKAVRQQLLEARRTGFNDGIGEVWSTLRSDTYSVFSRIHIPEPRGKGFKVEIEVKARLDDGTRQEDVDALRVFSESQVNALGIAAFITRAKMLGHRVLIFDDPVQSMDEDHFFTFASQLLTHVLDEGFQVVVLTHNDTFARGVSAEQRHREDFASLGITFSKSGGSAVDLGNRRLKERLAKLERALDKGDLDAGWLELRLAIERLLTVIRADHGGCGVADHVWYGFTAKQRFKQGVEEIIRTNAPRLAEQLATAIDMASAGAHDGPVRGETDLRNAMALVRKIAKEFGVRD